MIQTLFLESASEGMSALSRGCSHVHAWTFSVRGHVVITFSSAESDRVTRLDFLSSGVGYQNNQC